MTTDTLLPFDLPAIHRKKFTADFNGGNQSSNAGLLLLRQAERARRRSHADTRMQSTTTGYATIL